MKRKLLFLVASCASVGTVAYAQSGAERDSVRLLDPVEVTAPMRHASSTDLSRINVPLAKLPITITKIDVNQLRLRGLHDATDALRFSSSAGFRRSYGAFLQLNIRGFDYAPIIVDGMRDERSTINSYPLGDLSEVESIDLLKGPASVMQGHSAVGGVLSITRRRPTAQRLFSSRVEYGSWQQMRNITSLGGKIAGRWNGFGLLSYSAGDGWRAKGDKRLKVYGAIGAEWSRDVLEIRGGLHRDFYGTEIGLPPTVSQPVYRVDDGSLYLNAGQVQPGLRRDARYNNESDAMYHKTWNVALRWVHTFSPSLRMTEHASYHSDVIDYFSTEELSYPSKSFYHDALPAQAPYPYYYDASVRELDSATGQMTTRVKRTYINLDSVSLTFPLRFEHQARTLQNQLQINGHVFTGAIKHSFAVGHAFSFMRRVSFSGYNLGTDVQGPGLFSTISSHDPHSMGYMITRFSSATPTRTYSHGLYAQDVMEITPSLQAMLAMRYDFYHYERARTTTIDGTRRFEDPQPDKYSVARSQALTYRLGVVYTPVEHTNIYASVASFYHPYQTVYAARTIYVDADGQVFTPGSGAKEIFKPRRGYQAELGSRVAVGDWLALTASAFYIKQSNVVRSLGQVEVEVNGKKEKHSVQAQVGAISSKGFDVEATITPIKGLLLTAGYGFIDIRYTKLAQNPYSQRDVNEGEPLPLIPAHKWYSYGGYTLGQGALRGLDINYSISYRGRRYRNYAQRISFAPELLCDLGLGYQLSRHIRLSANVYNVLNAETYQESLSDQLVPSEPTSVRFALDFRL